MVAIALSREAVRISALFYGLDVAAVNLHWLVIVVSAGIMTMLFLYHLVFAFRPLDVYAKFLVA